jgi:hypothetical protein
VVSPISSAETILKPEYTTWKMLQLDSLQYSKPQPNEMSCRQQDVILWAVYFTLVNQMLRSYMKPDSTAHQNELQ